MKILYYDCFSGISGDMNLGALLDLGVDKAYLIRELSKLNIDGYKIEVSQDNRKGITGTKVKVNLDSEDEIIEDGKHALKGHFSEEHANKLSGKDYTHLPVHKNDEQNHSHTLLSCHDEQDQIHNHNHHEHDHVAYQNHKHIEHTHPHEHYDKEHDHHHHGNEHDKKNHVHRNLIDIEHIIENSGLSFEVKKLSKRIFLKVAEAEAKIHGKPLNEVHFHEVGAVDSIVDIIGAAICLDYLKVEKIMASSVELGGGFVKCAHGTFPVPAPATTEILKGVPVKLGAVNVETTTPTGAAILAAVVDEFNDKKEFTISKVAYGIGHRDTIIPNVLRVFLGEVSENSVLRESAVSADKMNCENALMLECNIDDMNPELYEYTMEVLFEAGAMDVFLTPIIMKKGRPAMKLSLLCSEALKDRMINIILTNTTTLGVRSYEVQKSMLQREFATVSTKYGTIKIKKSLFKGKTIKCKAEYEDCKIAAKEHKVPIALIYEEVNKEMNKNHTNS